MLGVVTAVVNRVQDVPDLLADFCRTVPSVRVAASPCRTPCVRFDTVHSARLCWECSDGCFSRWARTNPA